MPFDDFISGRDGDGRLQRPAAKWVAAARAIPHREDPAGSCGKEGVYTDDPGLGAVFRPGRTAGDLPPCSG